MCQSAACYDLIIDIDDRRSHSATSELLKHLFSKILNGALSILSLPLAVIDKHQSLLSVDMQDKNLIAGRYASYRLVKVSLLINDDKKNYKNFLYKRHHWKKFTEILFEKDRKAYIFCNSF